MNETLRKEYKRKEFYSCPKGESGVCKISDRIYHSPIVVEANCIPKQGKPEKTPESEKFATHVLKGGLKQYFPNNVIDYTMESCVNAGLNAKKMGNADYQTLSQRFVYYENLNKFKINTNKIEGCREAFLIGYNPNENPTTETRKQAQIDLNKAREIRKKLVK